MRTGIGSCDCGGSATPSFGLSQVESFANPIQIMTVRIQSFSKYIVTSGALCGDFKRFRM